MSHQAKYLNGLTIGPCVSIWAHVFTARDFKGDGKFKYDITLILTPAQQQQVRQQAQQLAQQAFMNNEFSLPQFAWPDSPVESKVSSPKLGQMFPGHSVVVPKAFPDYPMQLKIPNQPGASPQYVDMPEGQRARFVHDGALCYAVIDLASYFSSNQSFGIRSQMSTLLFWGEGEKIEVGSRPDANQLLENAGINVQLKAPNLGQPMPGVQGMPNQQMPNQQMPNQQMPNQQMPNQQMPGSVPPIDFSK